MLKRLLGAGGLFLLLAALLPGDDEADRDKLTGKWQHSAGKDDEVWALETRGQLLHITHLVKQKTEEFECNIMGKDCSVTLGGRPAKVSLWYNGGMLVEMETRGPDVVKRRFHAASTGDTLALETIPIVPAGKAETIQFHRVPISEAANKNP